MPLQQKLTHHSQRSLISALPVMKVSFSILCDEFEIVLYVYPGQKHIYININYYDEHQFNHNQTNIHAEN